MTPIEIGRLLRSSTSGCVVGCRVSEISAPSFGAMLRIPVAGEDTSIYGLIYDIHIDDDGLVRQLVTAAQVDENIIQDNRLNRNVPLEISVLFIGYAQNARVNHLLPPRPPLTLDSIYACSEREMVAFSAAGRFGYLRHILRAQDIPTGELLAAHLQVTGLAQRAAGNTGWVDAAVQELITLLRDDYPTLMAVLSALADTTLFQQS
jgi:hypothetical protein